MKCEFPDCESQAEHRHHVTYDPPVIKLLCRLHHEEITIINGIQARKGKRRRALNGRKIREYRKLSNKHRWWIWYQWCAGRLKPRRTKKAMKWVGTWG